MGRKISIFDCVLCLKTVSDLILVFGYPSDEFRGEFQKKRNKILKTTLEEHRKLIKDGSSGWSAFCKIGDFCNRDAHGPLGKKSKRFLREFRKWFAENYKFPK